MRRGAFSAAFPWVLGLSILVSLGFELTGCRNADHTTSYFPVEPGHEWQYRVQRSTMDGTEELRHIVRSIAPPAQMAGITGAKAGLDGRTTFYTSDAQGVYRLAPAGPAERSGPATISELVLPHTPTADSTWRSPARTSLLESSAPPWETLFRVRTQLLMDYQVEDLDASITTPAGHFEHCLLILGTASETRNAGTLIGEAHIRITVREWYAPGIGMVRMEREEIMDNAAIDRGTVVMELDRHAFR